MSFQRTPRRPQTSMSSFSASEFTTPMNSTPRPRVSLTDLRKPITSNRAARPNSPRHVTSTSEIRSRPGSAMGRLGGGGSRPSTPCASNRYQEPYTGSITVSIRPNPKTAVQNSVWKVEEHSNSIENIQDSNSFHFDNVFFPHSSTTNSHVYDRSCSQFVQSFLSGNFNATIFAYGMTGSGKTFSMRGDNSDPGFVRLAIDDIFNTIEKTKFVKKYEINLNYLEIYNEKVVDLLNNKSSTELRIRDDQTYGTKIIGISSPQIDSKEQLLSLIKRGDNNRKTSATDFNSRSSRSHSILQIKLKTIDLDNSTEQFSTLSLCDLAGSERATSSLERRKEGAFINKSLLALSTVINKLSSISSGNVSPTVTEHIPYRDSKLTRLLQPALSGSSLVSILCTVHLGSAHGSHDHSFISETYNTLRFAARAKDIIMTVQENKHSSVDEESKGSIQEMKRTIQNQRNEINALKLNSVPFSQGHQDSGSAQMKAENKVLKEKIEHLTRLTDLQRTETVILKNHSLNDLLGAGFERQSVQMMMANLENFYKRVHYEMEEYKSYTSTLEDQVKNLQSQNYLRPNGMDQFENSIHSGKHERALEDKDEEIGRLQDIIKDKDLIIKSLTKTSKLRRLVESNSANTIDSESIKDRMQASNKINQFEALDKENMMDLNI